jgi:lauroyl/myristoyl acyltransferase
VENERNALFRQSGGQLHLQSHFLRGVIECLRRGEALAIFFDARPTAKMTSGYFLGKCCHLHSGPVSIAMKTGAAVVLMQAYRDRDNRIHMRVDGTLDLVRTGNRDEDIRVNTQRIADYHTPWVMEHLEQWVMLKEFDKRLLPEPAPRTSSESVAGRV